ncbi:MAG: signal transduction histidine kinase [Oleiphilaceae bacterium]|jgi:signal transduction histidine kinase
MAKRSTKTLAQQLRWQIILAGIAFSIAIIVSLSFITWRSVEFAVDSFVKMEAHNLLKRLENEPELLLPKDKAFQAYRSWKDIPVKLKQPFSDLSIVDNQIYEIQMLSETGESNYISLLHYVNNQGQSLYALSIYDVNETDGIIDNIIENLIIDALWLFLLIFLTLFGFVFWLLKRTSEPMALLSQWAFKLKNNDHLLKEEFPIAELNDLASQLKSGVDKITEYNLREQQFLKYASHEIRTPLATIRACLDTLDFKLSGPEKKTVQRALKASSNMNRLSSALLWLARESEKPIEKTNIELTSFCEQQVTDHQYLINNRDVLINTKINIDFIEIETDLLQIVFANLLRNACQLSGNGSIQITIDETYLYIKNPTIPEDEIGFSSYQSFGLGLQLVSRICEKIGWTFKFSEHPNYVEAQVIWGPIPQVSP